MYSLSLHRNFTARHFLIGGDWGAENRLHAHDYRLEVQIHGDELDPHGFLVDLVKLEEHVEELLNGYRDRVLNELPEFSGLNPSLEHFARIVCLALDGSLQAPGLRSLEVRIWEDANASASYRLKRK